MGVSFFVTAGLADTVEERLSKLETQLEAVRMRTLSSPITNRADGVYQANTNKYRASANCDEIKKIGLTGNGPLAFQVIKEVNCDEVTYLIVLAYLGDRRIVTTILKSDAILSD